MARQILTADKSTVRYVTRRLLSDIEIFDYPFAFMVLDAVRVAVDDRTREHRHWIDPGYCLVT